MRKKNEVLRREELIKSGGQEDVPEQKRSIRKSHGVTRRSERDGKVGE